MGLWKGMDGCSQQQVSLHLLLWLYSSLHKPHPQPHPFSLVEERCNTCTCTYPLPPQVFDAERSRLETEYHASVNEVQLLRRDYRKYLNSTEGNKRKLQAALAKDPPKVQEHDK